MISVYPADEKLFDNNGIKILKPIKALIRKEDNGNYYIDIKDVIDNLDFYQEGLIIRAPTRWGYQCFRLSNPEIDRNWINIRGNHISFDGKNYIIKDSYVVEKDCNAAVNHLNDATDIKSPFIVSSNITSIASYRCVRKSLEEAWTDVIDRWGGHIYRNNYNISINAEIGEDRGVVISYAKNLKAIKATENWDTVVTKVLPVGKDGLLLPEIYLTLEEKLYDIPYTRVIDIDQSDVEEDNFKDATGKVNQDAYNNALIEDLRVKGEQYLNENKFPKVNYTIEAHLKDVSDIGDTIYVKHPKCNLNLSTHVIAVEYDCILEKYTRIEFGNFKNSLKTLIKDITTTAKKEAKTLTDSTRALLENELQKATADIWATLGNSYVIYDGDKILVVDKLPKEEAKNVIMINSGGIGFSSTGINGTFNSAWSIDGTLNMQHINVINLVADMIKGGTLKLGGKDNTNGRIEIYDNDGNLINVIDNKGFVFKIEGDNINIENFYNTTQQKFTDIEIDINHILQQLQSIENLIIKEDTNNANLNLENVGNGYLLKLQVHPVWVLETDGNYNIAPTYPNSNIYPGNNMFTRTTIGTLRIENLTTKEIIDYEIPAELYYLDENTYDILDYEYGNEKCVVTRNITFVDGQPQKLTNPIKEEYDFPVIDTKEGNYKISLLDYNQAYIYVEFIGKNDFTDIYATKRELNTSINQTNDKIELTVEEINKFIDEEVKTLNSTITETASSITEEVNGRFQTVDGEIKEVKGSVELKLNIEDLFSEFNVNANQVTIHSDNFTLDEQGNVTMNSAQITNGDIVLDNPRAKISIIDTNRSIILSQGGLSMKANSGSWSWDSSIDAGGFTIDYDFDSITGKTTYSNTLLMQSGSDTTIVSASVINSPSITQTSLETAKKNFEKFDDALKIIDDIDLYRYNLKSEDNSHKKHIGFVIGKDFRYSSEITSLDENGNEVGVDLYSMISLCLQAIKEQQKILNSLLNKGSEVLNG